MVSRLLFVATALATFWASAANSQAIGWSLVNTKIRADFPQVKRISTAELDRWLNDSSLQPPPLLLDVRTREEFDVSHLRNAVRVEPAAPSAIGEPKERAIVTYCSVGYRSGSFAEALRRAGYVNVVNLEGSIFQWANEGRPIYRDGSQVQQVHPYNRTWGLLLKKALRAR